MNCFLENAAPVIARGQTLSKLFPSLSFLPLHFLPRLILEDSALRYIVAEIARPVGAAVFPAVESVLRREMGIPAIYFPEMFVEEGGRKDRYEISNFLLISSRTIERERESVCVYKKR